MKKYIGMLIFVLTAGTAFAAPDPQQQTFATLDEAVQALRTAALDEDEAQLEKIFGPALIEEIRLNDPIADRVHLHRLAQMMQQESRIMAQENGLHVLEVGRSKWPFPVPLMRTAGRWYFDTKTGAEEVINRRIGENEIRAIKVANFFVEAQKLYRSKDRTGQGAAYAAKFRSSAGQRDGLYWPESLGDVSPFGPVMGRLREQGYGRQETGNQPIYHGYTYRILTSQGAHAPGGAKNYLSNEGKLTEGYALLASPTRWGVSGIMSFIVGSDGVVYEKDLGKNTAQAAEAISKYDPDTSWRKEDSASS